MLKFKKVILLVFLTIIFTKNLFSQLNYKPTPENIKNREWFQDAKYGLFIHWGVYSILGDGEWVMRHQNIPAPTYTVLPSFFYPYAFNAKEWVAMAKAAGMKYITITTRHHDGFSMFDSKHSDYNIVKATPYGKDIIKMLADECHKEGIKLFFYYSHLDWYQPDYYPRGKTGFNEGCNDWSKRTEGKWENYLTFMNNQLTELLTNYGEISGIWFDGWWDKPEADWKLDEQYSLIHSLQPACLIGNNHHKAIKPGEDFQMFEKDLPGQNTTGFSADSEIGHLPLETCETMNKSWGYNLSDKKFKTSKDLIHYLVKAAGHNSNFLLNVGPMPNGKIQPEFTDTLLKIGKWMDVYGETIYGTRGGPIAAKNWGVTTYKNNKVFVHILDYKENAILIPDFGKKIKKVYLFVNQQPLKFKQDAFGISVAIPENLYHDVNTVLVLEF
jgi:alpha-L-fucosidase